MISGPPISELPDGLSWGSAGKISGIPARVGSWTVPISLTWAGGSDAFTVKIIIIVRGDPPKLTFAGSVKVIGKPKVGRAAKAKVKGKLFSSSSATPVTPKHIRICWIVRGVSVRCGKSTKYRIHSTYSTTGGIIHARGAKLTVEAIFDYADPNYIPARTQVKARRSIKIR
jgi:hypothetical protein